MTAIPGATAKTFNDGRPVRLRFTPTVPTFFTRTLWVRAYRDLLSEVTVPGRFTARIFRGTTALAAVTKDASAFAVQPLDNSWDESRTPAAGPIPFVAVDLGIPIEIQTLQEHSVVLGAEGTAGEYTIHAQAWESAFQSRNTFTDGVAEFSQNGGASWNPWLAAGSFTAAQMVLPVMLQAGSSTVLPVGTVALMSKSLVDAAGVNCQFPTAAYNGIYATVKALLLEARISWIRDTPTNTTQNRSRFLDLATAGIKTLLIAGKGGHGFETADNILAYVKALNTEGGGEGAVCFAVQPEHEADHVAGESATDWVPRLEAQMTAIGTDYPADAATDTLQLVGPGLYDNGASYVALLAEFSTAPAFMTRAGLQAYHNGRHPESASGGGNGISLAEAKLSAQLSGADVVWITAASFRVRSEIPTSQP